MKKTKLAVIMTLMIIILTGCTISKENTTTNNEIKKEENMNEVILKINNNDYKIILEDNETVKDLINYLPLDLSMNELNNNEYYSYVNFKLKTNPENIKNIQAGDIMLYGNNCIVIFYQSFSTTYSYTKIGHIENIDNLENDLKSGNITFSKNQDVN